MGWNIEPIKSAPAAFSGMAGKINRLIKLMRIVSEMKGDGAVKVTVTDSNIVVSLTERPGDAVEAGEGVRFFRADLVIDPAYPDFPEAADIRAALNDLYDPGAAEPITPRVGDSVILYVDTNPGGTAQMRPRLIYTIIKGPGSLTDFPESATRMVHFNPSGGANSAGYAAYMGQTGIW